LKRFLGTLRAPISHKTIVTGESCPDRMGAIRITGPTGKVLLDGVQGILQTLRTEGVLKIQPGP
jgi:hypothetical protein